MTILIQHDFENDYQLQFLSAPRELPRDVAHDTRDRDVRFALV